MFNLKTAIYGLILLANSAFVGQGDGGGLPTSIDPVTYLYECQAELGIVVQKEQQTSSAVFTQSFSMESKKGQLNSTFNRNFYRLDRKAWILAENKSENPNKDVLAPYLEEQDAFEITPQPVDYSKTDIVTATVWLGVSDPNEVFSTRTLHLSDRDFDIQVLHKVRKSDFYSAKSLRVSCVKAQKNKE